MPALTIATKAEIQAIFDGAAPTYDRVGPALFRQFGRRLVELLALPAGAAVLDVATGTGAALLPAAARVTASGRAWGIDLSAGILAEAGRSAAAAGLTNASLCQMDAERLGFADGSFDAITCAFSLFFFPDMDAALAEMVRVCRPGGRIGLALFNRMPPPFDPGWPLLAQQVQAYGVGVRLPQRVAYTPAEAAALLGRPGLRQVQIIQETTEAVYPTEDAWWALQLTLGSRATILGMDPDTRARFKAEHLARVRPHFRADGLHVTVGVLYCLAEKQSTIG